MDKKVTGQILGIGLVIIGLLVLYFSGMSVHKIVAMILLFAGGFLSGRTTVQRKTSGAKKEER